MRFQAGNQVGESMRSGEIQLKLKIRPGYFLKYVGLLLFIFGLALLFFAFLSSRSSTPVILGRFSLPLALAVMMLGVFAAGGCFFTFFRPERAFSIVKAIISFAGRVPGLLELTVAFGWIPVVFLLVAGRELTPIAGEMRFLNGLGLLYAGWVILAVSVPGRDRRKALLERLLLLGITSVLGLVAIELTLRAVSPGSVFTPEIELIPYLRLEINVDLPDMSPVAIHTTNRWGFRGEDPPDDWGDWFTIVTIGGSTTHCYYTDDSKTWSHLLQEMLRESDQLTWVGNGGLSGHSTRAHIVFMREIIPVISPDMVILLVGTNDVRYSTRKAPVGSISQHEKTSFRHLIFSSSRLIQVLYRWIQINFGEVHTLTENIRPYEPEPLYGPEMELPDDMRELCTTLDEYGSNIRTIIRLGRESGVQVVFMTQPSIWEDTEYWRGIQGTYYWVVSDDTRLSAANYSIILDIFNKELLAICEEEGVPCLDLASLVPHSFESFYDGVHFNETGSAMVAEFLAEFLRDEGLVQLQ
jgi:lysophospholipase L1-like esterase